MTSDQGLHVVLFHPEIAANTGAIGRTASRPGRCCGWSGPWDSTSTTVTSAARRWTTGITWNIRLSTGWTRSPRSWAATGSGRSAPGRPASIPRCRYRPGDALVFGPESRGLPLSWLDERPDRAVRIPIRPEARSLNLANAVAIGLFEAVASARRAGPRAEAPPSVGQALSLTASISQAESRTYVTSRSGIRWPSQWPRVSGAGAGVRAPVFDRGDRPTVRFPSQVRGRVVLLP